MTHAKTHFTLQDCGQKAPIGLRHFALSCALGAIVLLHGCGGGSADETTNSTTVTATSATAPTVHILAGSGGGSGGGGGGGTTAPPPVISGAAAIDAFTGYQMMYYVRATSTTSEIPTITFNSGPPGMSLQSQSSYGNKYGFTPYTLYAMQWTPTREQIGTHSVSFTATTRAGSSTLVGTITVKDAPSPVTGLSAVAAADQRITARWDHSVGGVGAISHTVTACYVIPRNPALAPTRGNTATTRCEVVGSVTADQLVFSAQSPQQPDTSVYPFAATFPYYYVTVDAVAADGVAGTQGSVYVTTAP
jgi:hypothetical protein